MIFGVFLWKKANFYGLETCCSRRLKDSTFKWWKLHLCLLFFVGDMAFFLTGIIKRQNAMEIFNKEQSMERIFDVKVLALGWLSINTTSDLVRSHVHAPTVNNATTKSCYFILKSLLIFRRSADFKLRQSLAQSLILSRINYCNPLLSDAPHYLPISYRRFKMKLFILFMVKWMKMM